MQPFRIPGFNGINNRAPLDRLPKSEAGSYAVRDAVNVDLTQAGSFQRRPGYERVLEASGCRSLFRDGPYIYYASEAQLMRFDGKSSQLVSTIASSISPVCYVKTPLGLVWSDAFHLYRTQGASTALLAVEAPNPAPVAQSMAGGSLAKGVYAVSFATIAADGQRSAMTEPEFVDVPANGKIRLSMNALTKPVDVFVTAVDGSIFYRDRTLPVGTTQQDLSIVASSGEPVEFEQLAPMPAGRMLALHNGRLLAAKGSFVWYSKPYHYALHKPNRDYFGLDADITLLASVEGGVYVATSGETFFMPGRDVAAASLDKIANYGAIPGTMTTIPNSTDLMWFSPRGPVRASQSGELALLQDRDIAFNPATSGASVLRESNGLRTFIAALQEQASTGAAMFGSYIEADTIRN